MLNHLFYVNEVRLWLENRSSDWTWVSERSLSAQEEGYRASNTKYEHLPDAEIWNNSTTVGIEVELSRKQENRLRGIIYGLERRYPAVWYFTLPLIYTLLSKALEKVDPNVRRKLIVGCGMRQGKRGCEEASGSE